MNLSPTRALSCKTKEQFNQWCNLELRSPTAKLQTEGDLDAILSGLDPISELAAPSGLEK